MLLISQAIAPARFYEITPAKTLLSGAIFRTSNPPAI
jgi:hypothetical protein